MTIETLFTFAIIALILYASSSLILRTLNEEPELQEVNSSSLSSEMVLNSIERQLQFLESRSKAVPLTPEETARFSDLIYERNLLVENR